MSVPSYSFHFLSFKLSNKGMDFPFPPLKLPNKRIEEYFKIILFIPFHSIPSSQAEQVGGNGIYRRKHLFLSIPLKSQIFIPLKLREMGGNEIRF